MGGCEYGCVCVWVCVCVCVCVCGWCVGGVGWVWVSVGGCGWVWVGVGGLECECELGSGVWGGG